MIRYSIVSGIQGRKHTVNLQFHTCTLFQSLTTSATLGTHDFGYAGHTPLRLRGTHTTSATWGTHHFSCSRSRETLASIHEKTCLNIRSAQSCSHERKTATAIGAFLPRPCLRLLDTYHRESATSTAQPIISRAFPRTALPHLRPLSTRDSCLLLDARPLPPVLDRAIPRVEPASCDKILPKRALPAPFPTQWQRQAHDHVVTLDERETGIYQDTIHYILQNPVRARIVEDWREYPYIGALIPGYPRLDRSDPEFNERFWKIYHHTITT